MTWSAPGKLFLFGEYAVLRGAPAVVTAVDQRVVASRGDGDAYTVIGAAADPRLPAAVALHTGGSPAGITVDVRAMVSQDAKLGLGSSAASAVVLAAAMHETADLDTVYRDAYHAHRAFQAGVGSGADVAASCFGGTLIARPDLDGRDAPAIEPVEWPHELTVFTVWTGQAADTRKLVAAVDPAHRPLPHLCQLAEAAAVAFRDRDVDRILVLATDYDYALGKLGAAARANIRTRMHDRIARVAREFGATAKPSGAGGGDITLVFAHRTLDAATLGAALPKGARLLNLGLGAAGLRDDSRTPTA